MGICDSRRMAATVSSSLGGVVPDSKPALGGELIHQTVGQRIAERHAEFQDVHARLVERERQLARGFEIRIARADIDDEAFLLRLLQVGRTSGRYDSWAGIVSVRVAGCKFGVPPGSADDRVAADWIARRAFGKSERLSGMRERCGRGSTAHAEVC